MKIAREGGMVLECYDLIALWGYNMEGNCHNNKYIIKCQWES